MGSPVFRVGFIGIGNMGAAMCANLSKAGHQLLLCDAAQEVAQRVAATLRSAVADTPLQLAQSPGVRQMKGPCCAMLCTLGTACVFMPAPADAVQLPAYAVWGESRSPVHCGWHDLDLRPAARAPQACMPS